MDQNEEPSLMRKLTETKGPSGFEGRIHEVMKVELEKHKTHLETDEL